MMSLPEGHFDDPTQSEDDEWAPYSSEWEAEEAFEDLWDQCFPEVVFGTLTYSASRVLKLVDPIAYSQELLAFVDAANKK
jgi:hypothetical protein